MKLKKGKVLEVLLGYPPDSPDDDVRRLQEELKKLGGRFEKLKVDGEFRYDTKDAVYDFQKENGLKANGKVDQKTAKKLNEVVKKKEEEERKKKERQKALIETIVLLLGELNRERKDLCEDQEKELKELEERKVSLFLKKLKEELDTLAGEVGETPKKDKSKETPGESDSEEAPGEGKADDMSGESKDAGASGSGLSTLDNVNKLACVVASAVPGRVSMAECNAVAHTVMHRMERNQTSKVSDVIGDYSLNRAPTPTVTRWVAKVLNGETPDNTSGATHCYSPQLMPEEPAWARELPSVNVKGVRKSLFKFYKQPGSGPVK